MNFHAIGDLAQSLALRRQSAGVQSQIGRLSAELSSGQTANVTEHLNGSFGQLADIERRMALNEAIRTAGSEAAAQAGAMQASLEQVQIQLEDMSELAVLAGNTTGGTPLNAAATSARGALDAIVSALNTNVSGRSIFGGTAVGQAPLASSETLMSELRTAVAGVSDADGVSAALNAFFDAPAGGFETLIYAGGAEDMAPLRLGNGESVQLSIKADDAALRGALKATAIAALAGDDAVPIGDGDRLELLRRGASAMRVGIDDMTQLRADLGYTEGRIEQSSARIAAERTSLGMLRNEMLSVDRFETASALEEAQFQLETIYTLTARTSRLNLVNFL